MYHDVSVRSFKLLTGLLVQVTYLKFSPTMTLVFNRCKKRVLYTSFTMKLRVSAPRFVFFLQRFFSSLPMVLKRGRLTG